ncbi:MAG: hypothetical protein GX616_16310 [Planctomycetes bacterium]|nr:hypothetical protein [Planctomycetota bacterium]
MRVVMIIGILMALVVPASASLLVNGDMSLPTLANPQANDTTGDIDGWTHFGVGVSVRNGSANVGSPRWCPPDAATTAPYASATYGQDYYMGYYQVVSGLAPGTLLTLEGSLGGKTNNKKENVYMAILEQQSDNPLAVNGAVVQKSAGDSSAFYFYQVSYAVPASGQVVVQWGSLGNTGAWTACAAHADSFVLTPEPAGLVLLALGVAISRPRRRVV